ncbi:putative terpenoid cyclases protein prenyltransferase [Lyophyllum shimeji]|uniref:Geranylgeranyl transferase type-2 subunit beta n=1 Tax=Lyophyllum shimeji TaxID=47721 RepID=A0A9P3PSY9_LYOSH|nr:putative terpenoid cyclases protein prenyltransferase [Lyophyllum shimeji]
MASPQASSSSLPEHPFANSKNLLEILPNKIDVEEESRLYDELACDEEADVRSIRSLPASFQGPPSIFSKDIWLDDKTGEALAFARDVTITGWTNVGDKPEGGYIVYDCTIRTMEGTVIHALKRYSDFAILESALRHTLPVRKHKPHLSSKLTSSFSFGCSAISDISYQHFPRKHLYPAIDPPFSTVGGVSYKHGSRRYSSILTSVARNLCGDFCYGWLSVNYMLSLIFADGGRLLAIDDTWDTSAVVQKFVTCGMKDEEDGRNYFDQTAMTASPSPELQLAIPLHVQYIKSLGENKDDLTYHLTTHLRLNAVYWGLTALCIMGHKDALDRDEMIDFVMSCWDDEAGAFGAHPDHDAHLLSTLSAIQILVMQDALDRIDIPRVVKFVVSLQQPSGVFAGDCWGETDTRFTYCAVNALSLLGQLHVLDGEPKERAVAYIERCRNFDGGFGSQIGAESHAGQVFVCVAALAILDRLDVVDVETLGWWLCERQLPNGGLNGRPEKLEDVCYSFWVLSAMAILDKIPWIDADKLTAFILSAQDMEGGGIADRPGDMVDVFHTHFGVAGLSLLGYPGLVDLDPVYCMPAHVIEAKGLRKPEKGLERRRE